MQLAQVHQVLTKTQHHKGNDMGEFKPMVKMETTEPSVELKLKKGGSAHKKMSMKSEGGHKKMAHKMDGGIMGALAGATPVIAGRTAAPVTRAPARPSLAARRRAMVARPVKKGGACYKDGGIINTEGQGGEYRNTKMHTSKTDKSPAKTGDVKMGNAGGYKTGGVIKGNGGGYKTGGVALGNAGGFKKGGATKKFASGGSVDDSGRAQKMPQGNKTPSSPVSIDKLSGTFKKGGNVSSKKLQSTFKKENAPAMAAAKKNTDEVYSQYQKKSKKFADGGSSYDESFQDPASQLREMKRMGKISDAEARMAAENARDKQYPVGKMLKGAVDKVKSLFDSTKGAGSVTDTEKTISRTVTPPAGKFKGAYGPSSELKKFNEDYKKGGKTRK